MSQSRPEPRPYFSERQGRGPKTAPLSLYDLAKLVVAVFDDLRERGYMQEAFGYDCVDAGEVEGWIGGNLDAYFLRAIGRENIWPYWEEIPDDHPFEPGTAPRWAYWDSDTLFDVIEVMHDLVSEPDPEGGSYHNYNQCGWHYNVFSRPKGQAEYRSEINQVLRLSDPAYALDEAGRVVELGSPEFEPLLSAAVPAGTEHDLVTTKIDAAVVRFTARSASTEDRAAAVRDLADVLEFLRADVKSEMLNEDERAIFNIANNFAIRHHNRQQHRMYDRVVWLRWAFYVYLATIHAVLRVRTSQRDEQS